ncbi:MAG: hypothetical protein JOZ24_10190 [Candidatus Eremiobacteraeota bacterium]|nr:hypothetical protein [Candidatus Eremiobacteraeota bacterium]
MKRTPPWVFVAAAGIQLAALGVCVWVIEHWGRLERDAEAQDGVVPPRREALAPAPPITAAAEIFTVAREKEPVPAAASHSPDAEPAVETEAPPPPAPALDPIFARPFQIAQTIARPVPEPHAAVLDQSRSDDDADGSLGGATGEALRHFPAAGQTAMVQPPAPPAASEQERVLVPADDNVGAIVRPADPPVPDVPPAVDQAEPDRSTSPAPGPEPSLGPEPPPQPIFGPPPVRSAQPRQVQDTAEPEATPAPHPETLAAEPEPAPLPEAEPVVAHVAPPEVAPPAPVDEAALAVDRFGVPRFIAERADGTTQIVRALSDGRPVMFGFYPDGDIRFVDVDGGRYAGKAESARARLREVDGTRAFTMQVGVSSEGGLQAAFTGGLHDSQVLALEPLAWSAA